ncbi:alpha-amylase inhibitor/lipid transfer/seed storage family protein precursor [Trifolium repens]|nr:alpha-amylase inhibitor/lipid transfer/seed storage family protein precursor [Trifolium repens]
MASNKLSALIILFSLLAYSTFSHACGTCKPSPTPKPKPSPPPPSPKACPPPPKPKPSPPPPSPIACPPPPTPSTSPPTSEKCPSDTLKLGVCADILGNNVIVGTPISSKCCALLQGLVDLEAALCLCTAIKANVLGTNLNIPVTLSLLLSACQKSVPSGFKCS